jgi:plastocyanin
MAAGSRHRITWRALRVAAGGIVVGGVVTAAGVAGAAQQAAPAGVSVTSTAYTPPAVSVNTGEKVTWTIDDELPHNVDGIDGPDPAWVAYQSPIVAKGVAEYTFTQPGTYTYHCTVHPTQMSGTVTVTGAPVTPTPTPPGGTPTPAPTTPPPTTQPPAPTATTTPTTPGGATPAPGGATRDRTPPAISRVGLKAVRHRPRITLTLSETATVTVRVKRRGSGKVVRTARVQVRAGKRTLTVADIRLKRGRYVVELEARDSGGNVATERARLRVGKGQG